MACGKWKFCVSNFPLWRNAKSKQHNIKPILSTMGNDTFFKTLKWLLDEDHTCDKNTSGPHKLGFSIKNIF